MSKQLATAKIQAWIKSLLNGQHTESTASIIFDNIEREMELHGFSFEAFEICKTDLEKAVSRNTTIREFMFAWKEYCGNQLLSNDLQVAFRKLHVIIEQHAISFQELEPFTYHDYLTLKRSCIKEPA